MPQERGDCCATQVAECRDLVSLILSQATQKELTALFGVSKELQDASQSLAVWRRLEWGSASRGARRTDAAVPALRRSIERWWGRRLTEFDAGTGCPTFREMLTDDTLALVARCAPHLQSIRLWGCQRITDGGLRRLAAAAPPLRSFSLQWCGGGVCLDGLRAVVRACPRLESLSISSGQEFASLRSVGDAFAAELAAHCPLLHCLELSDTSVGDAGLAALAAAYGPRLRCLALNYSPGWSGGALARLAAACPRLESVSAVRSPGASDGALSALGACCPRLAVVCVDRCAGVTLDGVMRLVNAAGGGAAGQGRLRRVQLAGVAAQSPPGQQPFFAHWAAARGLRWDARHGVLAVA